MYDSIGMKRKEKLHKRICGWLNENLFIDKLNIIEWIVLLLLLVCIFLTLFYPDNFGMFLTYYWIDNEAFGPTGIRWLGNSQLSYGLVQQIICEIWIFPVVVIYHIFPIIDEFGAPIFENVPFVLWGKSLIAVFFVLNLIQTEKIMRKLGLDDKMRKWALILFTSCILVALPVFHIAQTDSIYLFFMLCGVNAFLDKKRGKFLLFFALSSSCKFIAVFMFVPLLLLWEKRVLFVLRDAFLGIVILPLERVWFELVDRLNNHLFNHVTEVETIVDESQDVATTISDTSNYGFFSHFYHKMLYFEFPAVRKSYEASVLVTLFVLFCIWCYMQNNKDDEDRKYNAIYVSAVSLLLFFTFSSPSPYWIVIMYPFVILLSLYNAKNMKINLLLMNLYSFTMLLIYIYDQGHVYGGSMNLDYLLLRGLRKAQYTIDTGPSIDGYLRKLGIDGFTNVITAVCFASAVAFVIINIARNGADEELDEEERTKVLHGFAIWQIGSLLIWYIANVWAVQSW